MCPGCKDLVQNLVQQPNAPHQCGECGYGTEEKGDSPHLAAWIGGDKWERLHTPKSRGGSAPEVNTYGMGKAK